MQVNQPVSSSAEPSTPRVRPPMASKRLDLPSQCDICGKPRSTRNHSRCSRIRQQSKLVEWASFMANLTAKKAR